MVIRRVAPRGNDPDPPRLLASYRRTHRQALGHGLYVGTLFGAVLAISAATVMVVCWIGGAHGLPYAWLWLIFALMVPVTVGAAAGVTVGVRAGVDADDLGMHNVSSPRSGCPWPAVTDIHAERRHGRTTVVIDLDSGAVLRLEAPYDGRMLGRDPRFERKFFSLLNLWETHRSWRSRT